jgi:uncharacterized protein (DUF1499 family)
MNKPSILLFITMFFVSCNGSKPTSLGVYMDGLYPCRSGGKCVSSAHPAEEKDNYIEGINVEGDYVVAIEKILKIVRKNSAFNLVTLNPTYLQYEHVSGLFSTIRDVEFFYSPEKKIIHLRAESRGQLPDMNECRKILYEIKLKYYKKDVK